MMSFPVGRLFTGGLSDLTVLYSVAGGLVRVAVRSVHRRQPWSCRVSCRRWKSKCRVGYRCTS